MSVQALISEVTRLKSLRAAVLKAQPKVMPDYSGLSLIQFIRRVSPHLEAPVWFQPYIDKLESGVGGGHELVFAAPPQHGKTVVTAHALVRALIRYPRKRFGYATYNMERALSVSRYVRSIAQHAGLELSGTLTHAYTKQGGGIIFAGRGTAITGEPIDGFGIVDDPFKGRAEAESKTIREVAFDWHGQDWMSRHHPGASAFIMATRWHEDDLSGRRVKEGWEYLNLPAVAERNDPLGREIGDPLCPSRWPLKALDNKRRNAGEYGWYALYQGHPRPKGGTLFDGAWLVDEIPRGPQRVAIGIDLAYSKKTHADYSVVVVMAEIAGKLYVLDVVRAQVRAPEFAGKLKPILDMHPGVVPRWYCAGAEKGVADLVAEKVGRTIQADTTREDKLARAQDMAAAWNDDRRRIFVPRDRTWADAFIGEIRDFTGIDDTHDDQVDAAVAAFDGLLNRGATYEDFTQFDDCYPQLRI